MEVIISTNIRLPNGATPNLIRCAS